MQLRIRLLLPGPLLLSFHRRQRPAFNVIIDVQVPKLEHSVDASRNCVGSSKLKLEVRRDVRKEPDQILHVLCQ